uniref:sensor histidine kinase n=1 Tax=Candidatus Enterococcus willemsii TaxID=1857215 RepID=UPI00403F0B7A
MTIFILLVTSSIDVWMITKFFSTMAEPKERKYIPYLGIIFPNLGIYLTYLFSFSEITTVLFNLSSYVMFLLFISYHFYMSLTSRLSSIGLYALIALLSESISAFLLESVLSVSDGILLNIGILLNLVIKGTIVFLIVVLSKQNVFQKIRLTKSIIILAPCLSIFFLVHYLLFLYVIDYKNSAVFFSIMFIFLVLFLNFSMFLLYHKMNEEKKQGVEFQQLKQNVEKQKQQLKDAIVSQNQLQSMRHDFKNSVLVLSSYIEECEYSSALDFITTIQKEISEVERSLLETYTPNIELNYLLLHKVGYAKSRKISTQIECLVPEDLIIENDVIIAIVGNLLDNAINACMEIENDDTPEFFLKLKYYNQSLFIDIKNSIKPDFNPMNIREGIGIKNIKQIVEKNSGIYRQYLEKDRYCVQIILWDYEGESRDE